MNDDDPRMQLLQWAAFILGSVLLTCLAVFIVGFSIVWTIVTRLDRAEEGSDA